MEEFSLSTSGLARQDRATYWASLVCDTFVELDCEVPAPDAFNGQIDCFHAGELQFFHIVSSPHIVTRTRSRIARSKQDDFLFGLQTSGSGTVSQDGRQAILKAGDFTIFDTTRPYDLRFDDDFSQIVMRLPRRMLTSRIADVERLTARGISGERGIGKLASSFVQQLHGERSELDPFCLSRVHASAIDLIAAAIGDKLGSSVGASECHVLLRRRISAYIDRNLADAGLSCETIATAHGISARHLSKVFEDGDLRVSQLIWARRLEQARRDLIDPLKAHISVTGVGYDVGFKDAAHFSRSFKARFGVTPSTLRSKALVALTATRAIQADSNNGTDQSRQDAHPAQ